MPDAWGPRARVMVVPAGGELPADEFSPETRRLVHVAGTAVAHDSHRDLKVVGVVDVPRLGGKLVGVAFVTDAYGPLRSAAQLLAVAGACVLSVMVGMLVFAGLASTQAVRRLSAAVRRVEAGTIGVEQLRIDTGDEIGELSAVVERYVRQSRELRETLEEKVRDKTRELSAKLEEIERADAALAREQRRRQALVEHLPEGVLLLSGDGRIALANPIARTHLGHLLEVSAPDGLVAVGGVPLERLLAPDAESHEIAPGPGRPGVFQVAARRLEDRTDAAGDDPHRPEDRVGTARDQRRREPD